MEHVEGGLEPIVERAVVDLLGMELLFEKRGDPQLFESRPILFPRAERRPRQDVLVHLGNGQRGRIGDRRLSRGRGWRLGRDPRRDVLARAARAGGDQRAGQKPLHHPCRHDCASVGEIQRRVSRRMRESAEVASGMPRARVMPR